MDGINVMDFSFREGVGPVDLEVIMPMVLPLLKNKRTCIQAGGCFGVWPVYLAGLFERVITFEPEPTNFRCLKDNTAHLQNVQCVNAALWSGPGSVGMGLDRKMHNNSGAYFIRLGKGQIPTVTIDGLNAENVDLLSLDIEGAEYDALLGAVETIARCQPVILLEDKGHSKRFLRGSPPAPADAIALCGQWGYGVVGRPTEWDVVLVHGA